MDLEARAAAEAAQLQVAAELPRSASLDVPALQQYPELPTGCESVALTNALLACGFDLQKTEIAQEWLPTGADDFVHAFMGDPTSPDGHSCMAPAIADTAAAYLAAHGSDLEAADLTGAPFRDVLAQAAAGNPVVVWCTIGLDEPGACYRTAQEGGRTYNLITNSHCVVVRGFDLDAGTVLVSDSLAGQVSYPLATFCLLYTSLPVHGAAEDGLRLAARISQAGGGDAVGERETVPGTCHSLRFRPHLRKRSTCAYVA